MAQAYSTGPPLVFMGVGNGGSFVYFGTCKRGPRIRIKRSWSPVINDLAGDEPFDWAYEGHSALIMLTLTRWNEPIYAQLQREPNPFRAFIQGTELSTDIGTLMGTEGLSRGLIIAYPFGGPSGKPAYATLPSGYLFPSTFMIGPDELTPSIHPYEITLSFYAMRSFFPPSGGTGGIAGVPEFMLYTTALPPLPPIN